MALLRSVLLKASTSQWLAKKLPHMAFSRRAVRRFLPGERLEDALAECAALSRTSTGSVITRLGENITSLDEADAVAQHYLDALADIERQGLTTHLSVKPTQLGLDISPERTTSHIAAIAERSAQIQAPVWIDMESSPYVDPTIALFKDLRGRGLNVGVCLQAYLHRTATDLPALLQHSTALRLVKGAYREPADVALQKKREVDANYIRLAELLLEAVKKEVVGHAPAIATHDLAIIEHIKRRAAELNIPRTHFEFHMLYGIKPEQQKELAAEGYRVRVLISYGSAWFAWYMRRLAERPANIWFVVKSLLP